VNLKYQVIERFRKKYPITALRSILEASRSGYYAWRKRKHREDKNSRLMQQANACRQESNYTQRLPPRSVMDRTEPPC